jgi:hypothetical protein
MELLRGPQELQVQEPLPLQEPEPELLREPPRVQVLPQQVLRKPLQMRLLLLLLLHMQYRSQRYYISS